MTHCYPNVQLIPFSFESFLQKENEFLYSKLRNISNRQPKPQINDLFLKSEAKKKQFNLKVKDFEREAIQRENAEMFKRMSMLKSFINTKALDEEYKTEHQKMVSKIRKINQGTTLLPSIYKTTNNRSKICKTEANKVEESKAEENKKEEPQNNKPQEQQNKDHCETAQN